MTDNNKTEETDSPLDFLTDMREFAISLNEPCPEGHRKDPASGRCLPMGSIDHTIESRSVNTDDGPAWRGQSSEEDTTQSEVALDAEDMDELESCAAGTTFSFIQRRCVSLEEADVENSDEFAMVSDTEYAETAAGDGKGGHPEIVAMDPEGRRDTVNFQCPPKQMFDFKLRQCIPLNKDTLMASEGLTEDEKQELARYLSGKVAMTSPDPIDGHTHLATLNMKGGGNTSISGYGSEAHSHEVADYVVKDFAGKEYTSRHFGHALPQEVYEYGDDCDTVSSPALVGEEVAAPIKSTQRNALPDSAFGVPGKRKFPLDTCARVQNAMARFNQAKGLDSSEKAALRRKILARARACDIEVTKFAAAETPEDFVEVFAEMSRKINEDALAVRMASYEKATTSVSNQGPCPPGMEWSSETKSCSKFQGFYDAVKVEQAVQPEGRRDPVNFQCPPGQIYNFGARKCISLDTSKAAKRDITPLPKGRPARLPQDCPEGTIWNADKQDCDPLDSSKNTKSSEEEAFIPPFIQKMLDKKKGKDGDKKDDKKKKKGGKPDFLKKKSKSEEDEAQTSTSGPGNKGGPGCPEGQFMNPITKKCTPRKGAFKGKSEEESAQANPGNREGLVDAPAGKLKLPSDCPTDTIWDAKNKICRPLDSMDKSRPDGKSPQDPGNTASIVGEMSIAKLISALDVILSKSNAKEFKERFKISAKELPNEAFPPSLVSNTRRSLMHHAPDVTDAYDTASVDIFRLRNALARSSKVEGYAERAVADAQEHLLWHARQIVESNLGKF